jgi:hypothetical protein
VSKESPLAAIERVLAHAGGKMFLHTNRVIVPLEMAILTYNLNVFVILPNSVKCELSKNLIIALQLCQYKEESMVFPSVKSVHIYPS